MRRTRYLAATALVLSHGTVASANGGAAAGPSLLPMKEIVVPIVDGSRAYGRLRVKLVLVTHDAASLAPLEARMPELRETALIAAAEFARFYASPFAPVDAARLARDVGAALTSRDTNHAISRVLLVGVFAERT